MFYGSSYRIPSFVLNLAHFHIMLHNEHALARQDVEYYAEVHITTSTVPLEGISHLYNANNKRNVKQ